VLAQTTLLLMALVGGAYMYKRRQKRVQLAVVQPQQARR
jgi:hypothetical protein